MVSASINLNHENIHSGAFRDFLPFVQFKKREKHSCSVLHSECYFQYLLKVTLLHRCFSRFLNCTNGTKSRNASHIHSYLPLSGTIVKSRVWGSNIAIKKPERAQKELKGL